MKGLRCCRPNGHGHNQIMMKQNIHKARLILNGVFCLGTVILCLYFCVSWISNREIISSYVTGDPDRDKGVLIQIFAFIFSGLFGLTAFISLMRTVKKWRGLPKE